MITSLFTWMEGWPLTTAIVSSEQLFAPQAARYAQNETFQIKFVLLALAGLNMLVFNFLIARRAPGWDEGPPPALVRLSGGLSLLLWFSVLAAGRLIAYDI